MHRIDTPNAQKDKFGVGKNGFTNGNPQTGELATELNADYFDSIQEEICGVIEGAGLTLDKTKRNQLLEAIAKVNSGALVNVIKFIADGEYIPSPRTKKILVEVIGGGGGGGGCGATSPSNASVSGGGGSGSYAKAYIEVSGLGDSVPVIIGGGGAGGIGDSSGGNGGETKFGGLISAPGGSGGTSSNNTSSSAFIAAGGAPGTTASGGTLISCRGNRGGLGLYLNTSTGAIGGDGAPSPFGGGGVGSGSSGATGSAGSGYGAGGGGNSRQPSSSAINGYPGSPGVVIIHEFS
ncbi:hypothetical protein ACSJL3_004319 [Serratia nevei]|uniref:glycine-rich domain-containing protein n=1 Tax=Serratia nevei TaxID=2703794 RepID=UPI003F6D2178